MTLYVYVTLIVSFIYRVLQNLMKSESVGSAAKERFLKGDKHISTLELVHESRYLDGTRMVTGTREELKQ